MCVFVFSLRGIKVEQRTLNDNASSLVDMAKVSNVFLVFILLSFVACLCVCFSRPIAHICLYLLFLARGQLSLLCGVSVQLWNELLLLVIADCWSKIKWTFSAHLSVAFVMPPP